MSCSHIMNSPNFRPESRTRIQRGGRGTARLPAKGLHCNVDLPAAAAFRLPEGRVPPIRARQAQPVRRCPLGNGISAAPGASVLSRLPFGFHLLVFTAAAAVGAGLDQPAVTPLPDDPACTAED